MKQAVSVPKGPENYKMGRKQEACLGSRIRINEEKIRKGIRSKEANIEPRVSVVFGE